MKSRRFPTHGLIALAMGTLLLAANPATAQKTTFPNYIPFNAATGEYPEGVAVDKVGNVFVSIPGQVLKFTPSGERSVLVDLGPPMPAGGLAVDAIGNVYVARPFVGVSRVDRQGNAELLPGTEWLALANGLAFDPEGNLYVTESFSMIYGPGGVSYGQGGIWRIPSGGTAEPWLRDDLLTGTGTTGLPIPLGANGIAYYRGALFVVNTELGIVVRVPVLPSGDPGAIEVAAQVPEPYQIPGVLPGADGLALDVHGNFYLAMPSHNVVVRMSPDGKSWETIGTGADFIDVPGSLAFGTGKGERTSLFITSMAMFPGGAGPGLVKIDAGLPGLPLP